MSQAFAERLGWVPKSDNLQATMGRALSLAQKYHHSEVTLEHFLHSLFDDPNASAVFTACQIDVARLRAELSHHIENDLEVVQSLGEKVPEPSEGLKKVMAHASAAAEQSQRNVIDGAIVLAALIGEGESFAANVLDRNGLTFEVVVSSLKNNSVHEQGTEAQKEMHHEADLSQTTPDGLNQIENEPIEQQGQASQWPHYPENGTSDENYGVPSEYKDLDPEFINGLSNSDSPQKPSQEKHKKETDEAFSSDSTVEDILASVREIIGVEDEVETFGNEGGVGLEKNSEIRPETFDRNESLQPVQDRRQHVPQQDQQIGMPEQAGVQRSNTAPQMPPQQNMGQVPLQRGHQEAKSTDNSIQAEQVVEPDNRQQIPIQPEQISIPQLGNEEVQPNDKVKLPPPAPNPAGYQMPPPGRPVNQKPIENVNIPRDMRQGDVKPGPGMQQGQRLDPPPLRRMGPPPGGDPRGQQQQKRRPMPEVSKGQLIENIPRSMRTSVPVEVEVRLARNDIQNIERGLVGNNPAVRHNVMITEAMTLQVVAPKGGFVIEHRSPETQWLDNRLGVHGDQFASWKWTITPLKSGQYPLHLVISARVVGERGVIAQSALPEQLVQVNVKVNYMRVFKRVAGWAVLALAGGALGKYSETILQTLMQS